MVEAFACPDPPGVMELMDVYTGERAFDVGANIGQSASRLSGKFVEVVSFEPAVESFTRLAETAAPNVIPVYAAVSLMDGWVELGVQERHIAQGQLTTLSPSTEGWEDEQVGGWGRVLGTRRVPCWALSSLMMMYGQPDFVKIDVEGHEADVVAGGLGMFRSVKPELWIEIHSAALGEKVEAMLRPTYGDRLVKVLHPNYGRDDPMRAEHWWFRTV